MPGVGGDSEQRFGSLLRNPGFTVVAVVALALGIGANAAIFGIYNAVALKQLPLADPSRVLRVKRWFGHNEYAYRYNFAYPEYKYLRDHNSVFSGLTAASSAISALASIDASTEHQVRGYAVSANYFADLGVSAHIGRTFLPDEDRLPGANTVVVLGYRFWQQRFNGDPSVIGQTIKLNGLAYTIVGVASREFTGTDVFPTESGFWAPLSMVDHLDPAFSPASDPKSNGAWREQWRDTSHPGFQLLARLKNGVAPAQAQAETDLCVSLRRQSSTVIAPRFDNSGLGSRRFKSCRPDHQIHCRLLVDLGGFELAPVVDRTQVIFAFSENA
jgi:hypothetical protein